MSTSDELDRDDLQEKLCLIPRTRASHEVVESGVIHEEEGAGNNRK